MPLYCFRIGNEREEHRTEEDHTMDLPTEVVAVAECLRTAAGLIGDLSPSQGSDERHFVELSDQTQRSILRIEIRAIRTG